LNLQTRKCILTCENDGKNSCVDMMTRSKTRNFDELQVDLETAAAAPLAAPEDRRKPGRPVVQTEQFTLRITADMRKRLAGLAAREQETTGRNVTPQQIAVKLLGEALKNG
jgi:hypothetical protein